MELEKLSWQVETRELQTAIDMVDSLAKALGNLHTVQSKETKVAIEATKVKEAEAAASKAVAEATAKEVQAKESVSKANKKAASDSKDTTETIIAGVEKVVQRTEYMAKFIGEGYRRSFASALTNIELLGGGTETQFKRIKEAFDRLTPNLKDPFDSVIGPLISINNELDRLKNRANLVSQGIGLTTKQLDEYSRIYSSIESQFKSAGKDLANKDSMVEFNRLLGEQQKQYLETATAVNNLTEQERIRNKESVDNAKAQVKAEADRERAIRDSFDTTMKMNSLLKEGEGSQYGRDMSEMRKFYEEQQSLALKNEADRKVHFDNLVQIHNWKQQQDKQNYDQDMAALRSYYNDMEQEANDAERYMSALNSRIAKETAAAKYLNAGATRSTANVASGMEIKGVPQDVIDSFVKEATAKEQAIKASRTLTNANSALLAEEEKMASVVATLNSGVSSNAHLSEKAAVSIANYERNLRLAGIAGKEAADKLALYRKQQEQILAVDQDRQKQYLVRSLQPQATDIFVSLASGQNPLTVLLQQGGQISDLFTQTGVKAQDTVKVMGEATSQMFTRLKDTVVAIGSALASVTSNVIEKFVGGISNGIMSIVTLGKTADEIKPKMEAVFGAKFTDNFSKLLGALRLATTAFVSFGVALTGPVLVALYQQDKVLGELNRTLISTAADLGLTSGQMAEMAKSMNIAGTSSTKILSVFNQLATTGKITASALQESTQAAIELERAGGRSAEETGKLLAKVYDDPVKSLREYQIATGLVSEAEVEHINTLVKTEGQIEAVAEAQKLLATATAREAGRMITEMTPIERLWFNIKTQIGNAWKEIVNLATSVPVVGALSLAFKGVALVVTTLYTGIKQIGEALGGMAAIASAAFSDIANKDISFTRTKAMLTSVGEQNKKTTDQWKDSVNKILELDEYSIDNMKKKAEAAAKEAQANSDAGRKRVINEETLKDLKKYQEKQLTETLTKEQYVNKMYNERLGKMKLLTEEQQKQFKEMFANEWEDAQKKPKKTEGDKEAERLRKAFIKDQKTVNSLLADSNGYQENYNKAQQKAVEIMSGPDFPKYTQEKRMQLAVDLERAIAEEQAVERQKLLNSLMGQASGLGADYYDKLRQLERAYRNQEVSIEVFELARKKLYETTEQGKQYVSFMNELIKKTEELAIARAKLEGERTATLIGGTEGEYLKEQLSYQEKLAKAQKDYNAEQAKVNEFYISKSKAPADEEMRIAAMEKLKSVYDSTVANLNFEQQTAGLAKFTEQFSVLIQSVELLGTSLTNVFGDFGTKLGSTLNSFANLAAGMDQNARQVQASMQAVADAKQKVIESSSYDELIKNTKKQTDAENILAKTQKKSAMSEITMYANLAGAAKGMFGEKTAAAKAFSAIEKVLHIARLGMMLVENAGMIKSVAVTLATDGAKQASAIATATIDATAAVIKAISSAPPPFGFVLGAAVAAVVGGLLVGIGGSMKGNTSGTAPKYNEGTGTVFGDSSAKSESFAQAEEYLAEANLLTQKYTPQMLVHLRNIDAQIAGLVNLIIRTGDVQNATSSLGIKTGTTYSAVGQIADKITAPLRDFVTKWLPVVGAGDDKLVRALIGGIFGKVSTNVTGQGLTGEKQSLGNIMDNQFQGQYYTDVQVKKKSWFSSSTKNQTYLTEAGAELEQQITAVFKGIYDSVLVATESLGQSQSAVRDILDSFEVDIGRVSLQGTGAEIQERLSAVFGAAADSIAKAAMPGLEQFQDVGEGYFATLIRVATELENINSWFDMLGVSLLKLGIEGVGANEALVSLFGSISNFETATSNFYDKFYSDEEKNNKRLEQLGQVFGRLGINVPDTIESYKKLVQGIDVSTAYGQNLYYTLISVSDAFYEVIQYANDATEAIKQSYEDRQAATDEAYATLKRSIEAEKTLLTEQQTAVKTTISNLTSIFDTLEGYVKELRGTISSTLSVSQARSVFTNANATGVVPEKDTITQAYSVVKSALDATEFSSKSARDTAYLVFSNEVENLKNLTGTQLTTAEQTLVGIESQITLLTDQLALAEKQFNALRDINDSVLQVAVATQGFVAALELERQAKLLVPAFAEGGSYQGGLALVGEKGPEVINFNKPGQVYTANQTAGMLQGDNSSVVEALSSLNENLSLLRAEVRADVSYNAKTSKLLDRVIPNGQTVQVSVVV